jgi:Sortase and related acyltransferases
MGLVLRPLDRGLLAEATRIWNAVIEQGDSFPDDTPLSEQAAWDMFARQTETVCALDNGTVVGVYILHPNNFGRCGHIANASFAVAPGQRGKGTGKALVEDCLERALRHGFKGLQFNAVVASNTIAIALYLKLGFRILGMVDNGYRMQDGTYRDTIIFLKSW